MADGRQIDPTLRAELAALRGEPDPRSEYRQIVGAITTGLARHRDKTRLDGPCEDGPDCVWCPAETIAAILAEKGFIAADPKAAA